ncbi:RNA-binding S4 domain-containing protein [Desulfosediminicola flagellatus]|uniref:RNA-binding S4 domain-containing protein n=1 Tax=Desulfosediminicola flagellatus TaxID=2569541 RepID=UPI0010AD7AA8|nr:RNA-binding S4 domain-containing protein [Desulfosediminicola flagellatus]
MNTQKKIEVNELPIRLGQLLKFANLVQDGFEAKIRIQHGEILLNGEIECQRGKKIIDGDIITFNEEEYLIVKDK